MHTQTKLPFATAGNLCLSRDKRQNGSAAPHHCHVPIPTFLVDTAPHRGPKGGYVARVKDQRASECCPKSHVKTIHAQTMPALEKRVRHFLGMCRPNRSRNDTPSPPRSVPEGQRPGNARRRREGRLAPKTRAGIGGARGPGLGRKRGCFKTAEDPLLKGLSFSKL